MDKSAPIVRLLNSEDSIPLGHLIEAIGGKNYILTLELPLEKSNPQSCKATWLGAGENGQLLCAARMDPKNPSQIHILMNPDVDFSQEPHSVLFLTLLDKVLEEKCIDPAGRKTSSGRLDLRLFGIKAAAIETQKVEHSFDPILKCKVISVECDPLGEAQPVVFSSSTICPKPVPEMPLSELLPSTPPENHPATPRNGKKSKLAKAVHTAAVHTAIHPRTPPTTSHWWDQY